MTLTKQEQKDEAEKAYNVIVIAAYKIYDVIEGPAWRARFAIVNPAWEDLQAKLKKIDEQKEEV